MRGAGTPGANSLALENRAGPEDRVTCSGMFLKSRSRPQSRACFPACSIAAETRRAKGSAAMRRLCAVLAGLARTGGPGILLVVLILLVVFHVSAQLAHP